MKREIILNVAVLVLASHTKKLNPVCLNTHLHVWFTSCSPVLITHIYNTFFFTDRAKVLKSGKNISNDCFFKAA